MTVDGLLVQANAQIDAAGIRVPDGSRAGTYLDLRSFRYYRSQGLVDPPIRKEGVSGVYGSRHLYQLLALKTLQAEYIPLDEIRSRLANAGDEELRAIAAKGTGTVHTPSPGLRNRTDQAPRQWVEFRLGDQAYAMVCPEFLGSARLSVLRSVGERLSALLLAERGRTRA